MHNPLAMCATQGVSDLNRGSLSLIKRERALLQSIGQSLPIERSSASR
jgi:hypothetical protein